MLQLNPHTVISPSAVDPAVTVLFLKGAVHRFDLHRVQCVGFEVGCRI